MKEISIEISKNGKSLWRRSSGVSEIVTTCLAQAFRHDIEKKDWDYITIELLNDWDVIETIEWTCSSGDFDYFFEKTEALYSKL